MVNGFLELGVCVTQNDRYMHPRPGSSSSTRRSRQRPASASPNAATLSHLPPRGSSASPHGRVEHRHPGFYGPGPSGGVDLQASVDQMNSSDANVDQLISGLEQLKGKRYADRSTCRAPSHIGRR